MPDKSKKGSDKLQDLKKQAPSAREADAVKGGAIRKVRGGDDDLNDLEVER